MSKFDHKKIMPRYSAFAILLTIGCIAVLAKALYTMTPSVAIGKPWPTASSETVLP